VGNERSVRSDPTGTSPFAFMPTTAAGRNRLPGRSEEPTTAVAMP